LLFFSFLVAEKFFPPFPAVGFGDMVPMTFVGRFAVLVMICVGVVVIPVQASQVYTQLQARRVTLGEMLCEQHSL